MFRAAVKNAYTDYDLVVSWTAEGQRYHINWKNTFVRGGTYDGDNSETIFNFESVTWSNQSFPPDNATYDVCIQFWSSASFDKYNTTLNVTVSDVIVLTKWTVTQRPSADYQYQYTCSTSDKGYLTSYPPPPPPPPNPPSPPPSPSPPSPKPPSPS
ncbi:hypothetical protein Vretimale_13147, partial [Volvox reticuliferus]